MWNEQTFPAQRAKPRSGTRDLTEGMGAPSQGLLGEPPILHPHPTPAPTPPAQPLPSQPSSHSKAASGWRPCHLPMQTHPLLPWRPASNQRGALLLHGAGRAKVADSCAHREPVQQGQAPGPGPRSAWAAPPTPTLPPTGVSLGTQHLKDEMNHVGQRLSLSFWCASLCFSCRGLLPAVLSLDICVHSPPLPPPTQTGLEEGDAPVHGGRRRLQVTFEEEAKADKVTNVAAQLAANC